MVSTHPAIYPVSCPAIPRVEGLLLLLQYDAHFTDAKSLDLSYQVDEFKALCTSWQKYQDELQDLATIGVQHCRK